MKYTHLSVTAEAIPIFDIDIKSFFVDLFILTISYSSMQGIYIHEMSESIGKYQ